MLDRADFVSQLGLGQTWLVRRILEYAQAQGYTRYTSTLEAAWKLSIVGISDSLIEAVQKWDSAIGLGPDEDFATDSVSAFGVREAQLHRQRGISFTMFLGLMKYYRRAYLDYCETFPWPKEDILSARTYVDAFFDRAELAFCGEWVKCGGVSSVAELQEGNRQMTNEKNRYLTLFESLGAPVLLFDSEARLVNLNHAAAELVETVATPGTRY